MLLALPDELILEVAKNLDALSLGSLASCCKRLIKISRLSTRWQQFCQLADLDPLSDPTGQADWAGTFTNHANMCYRWRTGQVVWQSELSGHTAPITSIDVDKNVLISGGLDKSIRVWDLNRSRKRCMDRINTQAPVFCVKFISGGRLISSGADSLIRVWNLSDMSAVTSLRGHESSVYSLDASPDAILSASEDGSVKLWSQDNWRCKMTYRSDASSIHCVHFLTGATAMIYGASEGPLQVVDLETAVETASFSLGSAFPTCLKSVNNLIIAGGSDGRFRLWDSRSHELICSTLAHKGHVQCVQLDVDKAVTGGPDGLRVWDVRRWTGGSVVGPESSTKTNVYSLTDTHEQSVRSVVFVDTQLFAAVRNTIFMCGYSSPATRAGGSDTVFDGEQCSSQGRRRRSSDKKSTNRNAF